jgi:L-aminopeptidase/D-esterase-like protein
MEHTNTILDVEGIQVGHAQHSSGLSGCTVLLFDHPAIAGVDQRGGAPGTRETDLLRPMHMVNYIDAILLTGGSAYGLDAAGGVMRYLEEKARGFPIENGVVPIVPAAVILDLGAATPSTRPDPLMGYNACLNAGHLCEVGNVGAGSGATVGKLLGIEHAMKSGIGSASMEIVPGLTIAALMVVNALGDIYDPANGQQIAGPRSPETGQPISTLALMQNLAQQEYAKHIQSNPSVGANTVIGVIATNAKLTKEEGNKLAQMAQDGIALTVRPAHTMFDGDPIFGVSTRMVPADFNLVAAYAAHVVAQAILNAVRSAHSFGDLPGLAG